MAETDPSRAPALGASIYAEHQTAVSHLTGDDYQTAFDEFEETSSHRWIPQKLFGRDHETQQCLQALDRISGNVTNDHGQNSELILIYGSSGCGKSVLAETLRGPTLTRGGFYTEGKFDQFSGSNIPYSAVMNALADLVGLILENEKDERLRRFQEAIINTLGVETVMSLSALIPNLDKLVGLPEPDVETSKASQSNVFEQAFGRLKNVLRDLLKAIAAPESPIVLFLDDLRWSDNASTELIKSFISDQDSKHIVIIVAYRDDEVDNIEEQLLQKAAIRVTDIHLTDLSKEEANHLIAGLLKMDDDASAMSLTEILLAKTNGNPFSLCQTLAVLRAKGVVCKSRGKTRRWEWDCSQVQAETSLSDNVLEIIAERNGGLHSSVRFVLQLAACLGHRFQARVLSSIIEGMRHNSIEGFEEAMTRACDAVTSGCDFFEVLPEEMTSFKLVSLCLAFATKERMVEKNGAEWLRFSHDRFQQYFYECLGDARTKENLLIGTILKGSDMFDPNEDVSFFLLVIDQLNAGCEFISSDEDVLSLIRMNIQAAKLTQQQSAYWTARVYVHQALLLRDAESMWDIDYDVMLECCTLAAEMNYVCSDYEMSDANVKQVVQYARVFEDSLPATVTAIVSFSYRGFVQEATRLIFETLHGLNRRFPKRPNIMHVFKELASTNKVISKFSDEDLLNLPQLTVETAITELQLLRILSYCAFELDDSNLIAVSSLRLMRLTCQLGKSTVAPYAFSLYGLVQSSLGNIAEATRFGKLGLQLLSQGLDKHFSQRTLIVIWDCCLHYTSKIEEMQYECQKAFENGLHVGMTYDLTTVGATVCLKLLMHGKENLGHALEYSLAFLERATMEHDFASMYMAITKIACQTMINHRTTTVLMPWLLNGDTMQEDSLLREAKQNSVTLIKYLLQNVKLQLTVFFNNWECALKEANNLGDNGKGLRGNFLHFFFLLYSGLTYAVVYNRRPTWQHKRLMNRKLKHLRKFAENGALICKPLLAFLIAEKSAGEGDKDAMVANFTEAIRLLVEDGFRSLEALATERLARNLKDHFGDDELSMRYMAGAITCYEGWGASRNVMAIRDDLALEDELRELIILEEP